MFPFGRNWARFLSSVSEDGIEAARSSLEDLLGPNYLQGSDFLDVGAGSGLFSLAARQLGARVRSFDQDPIAVRCVDHLRNCHYPSDPDWVVLQGSVLDRELLASLGRFDVVYAWGVLHHTGDMWSAMANVASLVRDGGVLVVALYNDQGWRSRMWWHVKRTYNRSPPFMQPLIAGLATVRLWGPRIFRDALRGHPMSTWRGYGRNRGMSAWSDIVDWVGGYPFDVATPEAVLKFYRELNFGPVRQVERHRGHACVEYVLRNLG